MDRRMFLAGAAAVLATPLAAEAQQAAKVYRIGVILTSAPTSQGTSSTRWKRECGSLVT